jgi:hypothetical protein
MSTQSAVITEHPTCQANLPTSKKTGEDGIKQFSLHIDGIAKK